MKNVTVIIPVYNNFSILPYLKCCISNLDSQCKQVIIIDDCSEDLSYIELFTFIKESGLSNTEIFKNEINKGVSFSRNRGLKNAKGEYIAFLDSDDDWHPQKIDIQVNMMRKLDVKICGTSHKSLDRYDLALEKSYDYKKIDFLPFSYVKWPKILFFSPFSTPSVIIHHSLKNYFFDEDLRRAEDYNLWKIITYKHKAIKILLPLTYTFKHDYISSGDSLSSDLKKMQLGVEESFKKMLNMNDFSFFSKLLIYIALYFSKIKYVRRILKSF